MNTTHHAFRSYHTADSQAQAAQAQGLEPTYDPFRSPTSLSYYHSNVPSTGDSRYANPHNGVLDSPYENDRGSTTGHTSSSHSSIISRSHGEGLMTPKPEGKTKRFPKFKFSLTASPPKPKPPKQPGQARPAVRVGGRGGAGNIKRIKTATPVSPGDPNNPVSVENFRAPHPLPGGETTNSEHESPIILTANREIAVPRMETGRGGTGNLYNHALEDDISNQVVAREDPLIRQYREMQAEQVAGRVRRAAVSNIKRFDDDADREYPTSPQSGSSGPRDFGSRGRGTGILRNKSSWTSSSGVSADIRTTGPDNTAYPNSQLHAPFSGEILGPLLEREDADVRAARGYDTHLVRAGSGPKTNAAYGTPSETLVGNIRSGELPARSRSRTMTLPRLQIPDDAPPLPSYQSRIEGRRPSVASSNASGGMAGPRSQDMYALDRTLDNEPDRHFYSRDSNLSSTKEAPFPSQARDPQRPFRGSPLAQPQRGPEKRIPHQFLESMDIPDDRTMYARTPHYNNQTAHTSPTIVSPPTPSTVFEEQPPNFFHGWNKGSKLHVVNSGSDLGHRVRGSGGDSHRKADPEVVHKSQEGGDTMYSDIFGSRGVTYLETDSVHNLREGTPFSDSSSVLIPRRASSDALSSMVKKAQNRPTNLHRGDIPLIVPTRPASRPRSQPKEEPLHCDELNMPPNRALSRMEKAILRRVEFGQNIDLSRIQLS